MQKTTALLYSARQFPLHMRVPSFSMRIAETNSKRTPPPPPSCRPQQHPQCRPRRPSQGMSMHALYLEGWGAGMASVAGRLLVPPSTLPGLLNSSSAMLASLPAAPRANLHHTMPMLAARNRDSSLPSTHKRHACAWQQTLMKKG